MPDTFSPSRQKHLDDVVPTPEPVPSAVRALAGLATILRERQDAFYESLTADDPYSPWSCVRPRIVATAAVVLTSLLVCSAGTGSRPTGIYRRTVQLRDGDDEADVTLGMGPDGQFTIDTGDEVFNATGGLSHDNRLSAVINGKRIEATVVFDGEEIHVFREGGGLPKFHYELTAPAADYDASLAGGGAPSVVTPMPGKVVQVTAKVGDKVAAGDKLMILEAMKMEHVIRAPADGVVAELVSLQHVFCSVGLFRRADFLLCDAGVR